MHLLIFIIPAYNEERSIGRVIDDIPKKDLKELGYDVDILVIDDGSADKTTEIALSRGVSLIRHRKNLGKGNALYTAFRSLSPKVDYVVMLDADCTYNPKESMKLLKYLKKTKSDIVIGSRLAGYLEPGSLTPLNKIGNHLFTYLVKSAYKANISDCCSGFVVWKKKVVDDLLLHCATDGFSIEMETLTKARKLNYKVLSVPITYKKRIYGKTKLHPIKDGYSIFNTFLRNLNWKPTPLN